MINLNECKFGDMLRTESGDMVVYLGKTRPMKWDGINEIPSTYYCAMAYGDSFGLMEYHENGWHDKDSSDNIVGRWEDEVKRPAIPYIKKKPRKEIKLPEGVSEEIKNYGKIRYV